MDSEPPRQCDILPDLSKLNLTAARSWAPWTARVIARRPQRSLHHKARKACVPFLACGCRTIALGVVPTDYLNQTSRLSRDDGATLTPLPSSLGAAALRASSSLFSSPGVMSCRWHIAGRLPPGIWWLREIASLACPTASPGDSRGIGRGSTAGGETAGACARSTSPAASIRIRKQV